jgi:peptide/nickel transport system substrate-binding protein
MIFEKFDQKILKKIFEFIMGTCPTHKNIGVPGLFLQRQKAGIIILFCLLLPGFTITCGKLDDISGKKEPSRENVLRYDVNAPFTSLNPATVRFSGSNHIFPLLYSYLFVPDNSGKLRPDLATKWIFDPEKLQWTIYLRNNAVFHNNKSVTSKDVKYSYDMKLKILRPGLYSVIDRISLLSDTILCVRLTKEDPLILQKIWDFEIFPYPDSGAIDYFNHPIGSGPFKFKERHANKEIHLEANPDYYNGRPSLDKIVFYYQPDKEKAWTRLLAGETDIAQEITPKNFEMLRQYEDRFYFDQYVLSYYTILLYNTYDPLFSDPRVRLALSSAIDGEHIVKDILNGYGKIANGPMGVDSPYHNPAIKPVPFAPQMAMALLKEAGWTYGRNDRWLYHEEKPFEFTLFVYKESQIEKEVACYIQLCFNEIGIRVTLRTLPFEELKKKYFGNTEFQAVLTEIGGAYRNPEDLKDYWMPGTNGKSIAGCFEHPEVTRLIKRGFEEKDPVKKKDLFYKAEALITSLQPGTFLFQKTAIDVMSKRLSLPQRFSLSCEGTQLLSRAALRHE